MKEASFELLNIAKRDECWIGESGEWETKLNNVLPT